MADDEPYVTSVISAALRKNGATVLAARNGSEAFSMAAEDLPDLIISDYQMPVLSGFDMSVKLKQDPRTAHIPILLLTARGHHLQASQLAATNVRLVMSKPFSVRELTARVVELLAAYAGNGGQG